MMLLQLSSAQGPEECELAVAKALRRLLKEAAALGVEAHIVEQQSGARDGTLRSVLLSLDGEGAPALIQRWHGTIQWTCPRPFRPSHPRKNWFIGIAPCSAPSPTLAGEIRFEAMRASGPGGQHVNKTASAIRATHVATGISVRVQSERSQHANKRIAIAWIAHRLNQHAEQQDAALRAQRQQLHHQVARGNAALSFKEPGFEPV